MSSQFQDWNPLIIGNNNKNKKKEDPLNLKHREGQSVETLKKNKIKENSSILNKLENDEIIKIETIPLDVSKKIQQARTALKMTRKDLAQKLNVKENIIIDLENAKYKFDKQLIRKIEKILNHPIL